MHLEPEHAGGIAGALSNLAMELAKQLPTIMRRVFPRKKKKAEPPAPPPSAPIDVGSIEKAAEFRGEIHEFKRACLEELKVQRERYHGLRTAFNVFMGIDAERRRAHAAGEEFDTAVYEVDLKRMLVRLDSIPDAPLPQLTPGAPPRPTVPARPPRPPFANPNDDESEPE